jgi:hypothetical protein
LKTLFGLLKNTGDKIAGATGSDVKLRAERKLGGSPEGLPHAEIADMPGPEGQSCHVPNCCPVSR